MHFVRGPWYTVRVTTVCPLHVITSRSDCSLLVFQEKPFSNLIKHTIYIKCCIYYELAGTTLITMVSSTFTTVSTSMFLENHLSIRAYRAFEGCWLLVVKLKHVTTDWIHQPIGKWVSCKRCRGGHSFGETHCGCNFKRRQQVRSVWPPLNNS